MRDRLSGLRIWSDMDTFTNTSRTVYRFRLWSRREEAPGIKNGLFKRPPEVPSSQPDAGRTKTNMPSVGNIRKNLHHKSESSLASNLRAEPQDAPDPSLDACRLAFGQAKVW